MNPGDKYYPSNGTEEMMFESQNCNWCYKEKQCTILTGAYMGKEPKQWVYGEDGKPVCTSLRQDRPKRKKTVESGKLFKI